MNRLRLIDHVSLSNSDLVFIYAPLMLVHPMFCVMSTRVPKSKLTLKLAPLVCFEPFVAEVIPWVEELLLVMLVPSL